MTTPFPPLTDAERALYLSGHPVEAVRQYRTRTGLGLEDAYRAVFGTAPATTPAFGGYLAVPQGSGNATIFAWWTDGRAALRFYPGGAWHPHPAPDYAALFHPAAPASFGETAAAPWDRGPEPTQDRPDDAPDPGRDD